MSSDESFDDWYSKYKGQQRQDRSNQNILVIISILGFIGLILVTA